MILRHFIDFFLLSDSNCFVLICEIISTAAIPIFFVLSGYLFFLKPFTAQRLKNQLLRVLKLYLAWKVVYLPISLLSNVQNRLTLLEGVWAFIRDLIFPDSHLWYLTALMLALVIVSLIRNMKLRYSAVLSVGLFIAGLLLDTYKFSVPQLSRGIELYLSVFHTARNGLFFGTIYVYLGYIFSRVDFKIKRLSAALGTIVSLFLLSAEKILLFKYRGIIVTDITIFALPVSVFVFLFARQQEVKIMEDRLLHIRKISTALYCVHPIFILGCMFINSFIAALPVACIFALMMLGSTAASIIIVKLGEKYKLISYLV